MLMSRRLLVVDDDDDLRESLELLLARRGYEVETAADGQEALERLRRDDPPCLILLDLMMPRMDGWQLRAELAKDQRLAEVPLVLLSGAQDIADEARSLAADDYLVKPVDLRRVYALADEYCSRQTHSGADASRRSEDSE